MPKILLILIFMGFGGSAFSQAPINIQAWKEKIDSLYLPGKRLDEKRLKLYKQQGLALKPKTAEDYYFRSFMLDDRAQKMAALDTATQLNPNYADAWLSLASMYWFWYGGDPKSVDSLAAKQLYYIERAVACTPPSAEAFLKLAQYYIGPFNNTEPRNHELILESLNRSEALDTSLNHKRIILLNKSDYYQSIKQYDLAEQNILALWKIGFDEKDKYYFNTKSAFYFRIVEVYRSKKDIEKLCYWAQQASDYERQLSNIIFALPMEVDVYFDEILKKHCKP
jgi:hypothetical protein